MTPGYLTKRFVQTLREEDVDVKIRPLGKYAGLYLLGTVYIDHKSGDVLGAVVHELLHHLYEHKPHEWIYKTEKWWVKTSSWKMKKAVLQELLYRT